MILFKDELSFDRVKLRQLRVEYRFSFLPINSCQFIPPEEVVCAVSLNKVTWKGLGRMRPGNKRIYKKMPISKMSHVFKRHVAKFKGTMFGFNHPKMVTVDQTTNVINVCQDLEFKFLMGRKAALFSLFWWVEGKLCFFDLSADLSIKYDVCTPWFNSNQIFLQYT